MTRIWALILLIVTVGSAAAAEPWPQRTVRLITPFAPGTVSDLATRLLAERLSHRCRRLVRQGARSLHVIDHDRVEEHNIGTQVYEQTDIGKPKVDALRNRLFRVAGVEIDAVRKELSGSNARSLLKDFDLIVDCFDNSTARLLVQNVAKDANIATLHVGLSADYGEVIWDEQYRVPGDVGADTCDYPLARNIVLLTTTVAAETVVRFVDSGARTNWSITLGDLTVLCMDEIAVGSR